MAFPSEMLRAQQDVVTRLLAGPLSDDSCEYCGRPLRYDADEDHNGCPVCEAARLESMSDALRSYRPGKSCPECCPDGVMDTDRFDRDSLGICCSTRVPWDEGGGFCPDCKEHSANRYECETCGAVYEDWDNGTWERKP